MFEVLSSTELASGPSGRVVRIGGRCMAGELGDVPPPSLLAGGLRIAPRERQPLHVGPTWSPFALTYAIPAGTEASGWQLEVAPPSCTSVEAAARALEAVEAIHARIDQLEARLDARDTGQSQPALTP
ncbi:MAG TPA: hypothetical protein VFL73_05360 [Solirubrobacteraceae bacterium]|nr:hypothetical protein [Solirubrobacteraceae bacterium]